ncbi:MAG: trypsin-like serine protease [Proteobacteria bacterium]|nr:trypsin-like serine protease [Pseudomonadota bacterium]
MKQIVLAFSLLGFTAAATWAGPTPIVGGTTTKAGDWPDVVAVLAADGACSGTLIAPDLVLTAGHCAALSPHVVVVDTLDYGKPGGETIDVVRSYAYPRWQETYDVGVVELAHPAHAKPRAIARACSGRTIASEIRIVGFGLTDTAGAGDNSRLHQAAIAVDDPRCTEAPGCNAAIAPDGEFTAGGHGTDSCFGDSGGPAFAKTPSGYAVLGVVSRGMALAGRPCGNGGIYVRADKVVPWIERTTGRELVRAPCDQPADAPAADDEEAGGGCTAAAGADLAVIALVAGFVWRRRRAPCAA